jgi:hypothetical protein
MGPPLASIVILHFEGSLPASKRHGVEVFEKAFEEARFNYPD